MAARKSLTNITFTYNGTNVTQYCKQVDLEAAASRLDTTNLASTAVASITDVVKWSIGCNGYWDLAFDALIAVDLITTGTLRTGILVVTGSTGAATYTFTSGVEIENYKISAGVGAFIGQDTGFAISVAPVRT